VVQCVGVPDDLLADELFGHAADPAAGIVARRGRLELARSGTLVLHEFTGGPGLQARLASVAHEPAADIRVVVTTGAERADGALWELLNAELAVPPLRERRPELPELARYYMSEAAREFSRNVHEISSEAIEALAAHDWPGNLRELQHALERVVMLCAGPVIEAADLPTGLRSSRPA
jgi:DNA-binding NtrC family response regulator